jgi:hypothetical protein
MIASDCLELVFYLEYVTDNCEWTLIKLSTVIKSMRYSTWQPQLEYLPLL